MNLSTLERLALPGVSGIIGIIRPATIKSPTFCLIQSPQNNFNILEYYTARFARTATHCGERCRLSGVQQARCTQDSLSARDSMSS
jgi:hypothetical protein